MQENECVKRVGVTSCVLHHYYCNHMNVLLWGGYKDEATEKLIYKTKNVLNRETDDLDSNIRRLAMR